MKIQDKLYARAILLEQFKKGVDDYKKALKAVHSELGSKVMSRVSASLWYKRFQQDDFSMGAMKTVAGRVLSKNLNMLKTMRALYCSLRTEEEPHHCTTSGSNGRFQFLSYQGVHWVVDTFHGQQKQMNFDWCGIQKNKRGRSLAAQCSKILSMDYVDETTVLIVINNTKGTALLRGTFDLNNCTTKVTDFLELPRGFSHVFVPTSQQIGCVRSHWGRNNNYHTISCQNSLQLELKLQNFEALGLLTQRDGFLFGFHCDTHSNINAKSLVHVSLDDGVVTKHATKLFAGLPTVSFYCSRYVWMDEILIVGTQNHESCSFVAFNKKTLEWINLSICIFGNVQNLTTDGKNVLIVQATNKTCRHILEYYRFAINGVDSLSNLTWMSLRRRAQFEPEIYHETLELLPQNSPFRCPWPQNE